MMIPPLNLNPNVVVPWASLIGQSALAWSSVTARRNAEGYTEFCVSNDWIHDNENNSLGR